MSDRIIRDELLTSERYCSVSDKAKLMFIHLLLNVDNLARFSGKNFTLRAACFPNEGMKPEVLEGLLAELVEQDLVRVYMNDGNRYVFVPRFKQRLRYNSSSYPPPPNEINDLVFEKSDCSQSTDGLQPDRSPTAVSRSEVKRSEENKRKGTVASGDAPQGLQVKPTKGTRLPNDWEPTPEMIAFCRKERPNLDPLLVAESFKDYWIAKPGQAATKLDWLRTWRNWVRNTNAPSIGFGVDSFATHDKFAGAI